MSMTSCVVKITPEMARDMLEHNMKCNRKVNKDVVQRYARIMRSGGWNLTHQGIAFDDKGELIDGQHRLNAIVTANIPVDMMVTYNVEHHEGETFTIDVGRKRTTMNIMQISGLDDPVYKYMYQYISCYLRWKAVPQRRAEPVELMAYIDRHYDDVSKLYQYARPDNKGGSSRVNRIPAIVGAALLAAMYRGENEDAIMKFCNVYRFNNIDGCENYNPRHVLNLRDYVRDHKYTSDVYNRCESVIYAFANNRSAMHVRDNCYPYNATLDA